MKKFLCCVLIFIGAAAYVKAAGIADEAMRGNERADASYAFGMAIATDIFLDSGMQFNYDAFIRGFRNVMEGNPSRFTLEEAFALIQGAYITAHEQMLERNLAEGEEFLAENALQDGVVITPSGLQYKVIIEGTGDIPDISDTVLVHYRGMTITGVVFDTTFDDGPVEVPLDMVISGWSEGIRMMREGGTSMLFIPPHLAYGEDGAAGMIPPNTTLIFEVQLIGIVRAEEQ